MTFFKLFCRSLNFSRIKNCSKMLALILIALLAELVTSQQQHQIYNGQATNRYQDKFVYDLLKTPLTADEVRIIMSSRDANAYPQYNAIPQTSFNCVQKGQAGFYADVDVGCQLFHRCDLNGNQTDYLCVNSTVFNQITLVCDSWYNVDCPRSQEFENFANSRLYSNRPLFDTPPADYISPVQLVLLQNQGLVGQSQVQPQQQQTTASAQTPTNNQAGTSRIQWVQPQPQKVIIQRWQQPATGQ